MLSSTVPVAGRLTSIETWVLLCLSFIFVALVEYAVVLVIMRAHREKGQQKSDGGGGRRGSNQKGINDPGRLDRLAVVAIPAAFFIANLVYWSMNRIPRPLQQEEE